MGFWDGSGISWTICKQSAPHSRPITMPTPHHSTFTGRMPFLMPNEQCRSTAGILISNKLLINMPFRPIQPTWWSQKIEIAINCFSPTRFHPSLHCQHYQMPKLWDFCSNPSHFSVYIILHNSCRQQQRRYKSWMTEKQTHRECKRNTLWLQQNITTTFTWVLVSRQEGWQNPVPNIISTYGRWVFLVAGPMAWNSLPDYIWDPTSSTDCFRRLLKTYLFARY